MSEAVVYSKSGCPFCVKVKHLLRTQNIPFTVKDIGTDLTKEEAEMELGRNISSVPQVVIDGKYIGGYTATKKELNIEDDE